MPQMSPMNWFFLFLFFNSMIFFFLNYIYFLKPFFLKKEKINLSKFLLKW